MKSHEYFYFTLLYTSYILYFLLIIGFQLFDIESYIVQITSYIKFYICFVLILRFNPWRTISQFSDFDQKLVFTSALFLLTSIGFTEYIEYRQFIDDKFRKFL